MCGYAQVVTTLTIEQADDYPSIKSFPITLHELHIVGCSLTHFDRRWIKLTNLVVLEVRKGVFARFIECVLRRRYARTTSHR